MHIVGMVGVCRKMPELPAVTLFNKRRVGDELLCDAFALSVEIQVLHRSPDVQRPRTSIQVEGHPVVHLECEDVRCRADFQDQVVASRAVEGSRRNQVQTVLHGRLGIDVLRDVERSGSLVAPCQGRLEFFRDNVVLESEIDLCTRLVVEDIVGFLLSEHLSEVLLYVFLARMTLY